MAQGVGRDCFGDSGGLGQPSDDDEDHLAGHAFAAAVEKEYVFVAGKDAGGSAAPLHVVFDATYGYGRHRHHALFVAFAVYHKIFFVVGDVADLKVDEFGNSQAGRLRR